MVGPVNWDRASLSVRMEHCWVSWLTQAVLWDTTVVKYFQHLESVGTPIGYNLGVGQLSFSPDGCLPGSGEYGRCPKDLGIEHTA
jgi:hypothetical protein